MASSLQQQLAAIAAKSTHQLDLKAQKARHSKSLLFQPRDAAAQRFDTLFQICFEGFEELCQLDNRFLPFGRNLFSEQSKNEERTQMTKDEVQELDKVIVAFLGLLGGRLLLKPGMKAAEWLVRRFQVHEYNTEALLMTFLPYHASLAFPTLLSILPEQLPSNFKFLHPYVASLQSPPRPAIITAISNNAALFTAFSRYVIDVSKARHHSTALLGFWASITAQAVNSMIDQARSGREAIRKQREEDILLQILPVLQSALLIRGIPELYLGACMILAIVATQAPPDNRVLNAMMEAVANGCTKETSEDGITCLAVLAEEKQDLHIPRSVSSYVLEHDDSAAILMRISLRCRTDRLLAGVALAAMKRTIAGNDTKAAQFLLTVPRVGKMSATFIHLLLKAGMNGLQGLPQSVSGQPDPAYEVLTTFLRSYISRPEYTDQIRSAAEHTNFRLSEVDTRSVLASGGLQASGDYSTNSNSMDTEQAAEKPFVDLSALPELPNKDFSFLTPNQEDIFRPYSDAFRFSLKDEKNTEAFIGHASLMKTKPLKHPNFLTFFARVWSSEMTTNERRRALEVVRSVLERTAKAKIPAVDSQAIIPYLIYALADSSKAVRADAAAICFSLEVIQRSKKQESGSSPASIWSNVSIYGELSSKIQWLSTDDSDSLLMKLVVPRLDDCILDDKIIATSMVETLNGSTEEGHRGLKSASRNALCRNLLSHALVTPASEVKINLLDLFSRLGKAASSARTTILVPYIRDLCKVSEKEMDLEAEIRFIKALIKCLSHRSKEELELLKSLATGKLINSDEVISTSSHRIKKLFASVKGAASTELFSWLLDISVEDAVPENVRAAGLDTIRNIAMSTEVLVHAIDTLPSVVELQDTPSATKKQRNGRTSDTPKLGSVQKEKLTTALKRITLVLELIEGSKPAEHPQLLKGLFLRLGELHNYKVIAGSDLVYLHGLLIGNLQSIVDGLKSSPAKDVDRSVVRADLIVECVRTTPSTQIHNAALLLMSSLASWAPDHVLHSVMPLFTFMSSTILKQGDDYSAHVTERAVTRIIPPLVASLSRNGKDLITEAADLLLSFTAAFEHIPLHRRSGIFQHLVETLGAEKSLHAIVAMLIERYRSDATPLSFVMDLMSKFAVGVQLQAASKYLDLVFDTLKPKRSLSNLILGYGDKNERSAKQATVALQAGLATTLASDTLRRQLLKELRRDEQSAEMLRVIYSQLLEKAMQLVLHCRGDEELQPSADKVLSALLRLMPTKDFIEASAKLMQTGTDEIRQQVFASLEDRVATAKRGDSTLQGVFLGVLPNCSLFITQTQPTETRRAAIACIDQIAEKFGKKDRAAIVDAARLVAGNDALGSDDPNLRIISLLCLASMVEVVEDEFIPILPSAFQKALDYLDDLHRNGDPDPSLHRAAFSLVSAVLDHLPWMLSARYLDHFLELAAGSATEDSTVAEVAKNFCLLAARKLPASDCFGAIDRTWVRAVARGPKAVQLYIQMLESAIQFHTKATVTKNAPALFSVLQAAFDLRSTLSKADASRSDELQGLYSSVDLVALEAVMKLNDATFRPFFTRLVGWATDGKSKKDRDVTHLRCTSLYSFSFTLFEQLKSLVTNYVSLLMESAINLLKQLSSNSEVERELLKLVLLTLASNFRHDQDEFWQAPAHFEAVSEPLLAQLKKADTLPLEQHVIPAITDLAAAAGAPEHHKAMNAVLMACMRHEDAAVRLAAVQCERSITSRLNLDWLTLLPEMLPFISELQEDDDEPVERETLRWVKQIEEITAESLWDMLQ